MLLISLGVYTPGRSNSLRCRYTACQDFSVPNKPKTPLRAFRVADDLWHAAQERAAEEGETVSDVLRRALAAYVGAPKSRE